MNVMAKPRLVKIVLNVGVKEALEDKKVLDVVSADLAAIAGQKPAIRKAKKSIANFKLREGQPVVTIVLPRVRDFHGVPISGFDGNGNYTLGLREHIVFPEIDYGKIDKIRGLEISIVTTAKNDEDGLAFLKELGMPFVKS